jgi:hypothetical protein
MRMLWRATKTVAFARQSKFVVVWYCPTAGKYDDPAKAEKNIGELCIVDGYDNCFNQLQLDATNEYRATHSAAPLKLNAELAKYMQTKFAADPAAAMPQPETPLAAPCDGGVGFNRYTEEDAAMIEDLKTTPRVTDQFYSYHKEYSFSKNKPKNTDLEPAAFFTRMVWRGTTDAAWVINGKDVMVGYCAKNPQTDTDEAAYKVNVQPACVKDGYDTCFNKLQLEKNNALRL